MAQKIVISRIFRNNLKGNFSLCLKCNAIIIHSKDELDRFAVCDEMEFICRTTDGFVDLTSQRDGLSQQNGLMIYERFMDDFVRYQHRDYFAE